MLHALAQMYGKTPDEIATRPWSILRLWLRWAGMLDDSEVAG